MTHCKLLNQTLYIICLLTRPPRKKNKREHIFLKNALGGSEYSKDLSSKNKDAWCQLCQNMRSYIVLCQAVWKYIGTIQQCRRLQRIKTRISVENKEKGNPSLTTIRS